MYVASAKLIIKWSVLSIIDLTERITSNYYWNKWIRTDKNKKLIQFSPKSLNKVNYTKIFVSDEFSKCEFLIFFFFLIFSV